MSTLFLAGLQTWLLFKKNKMEKIIVQIYEIQTPKEAEKLIDLGVDHIGSVIVSKENWKVGSVKETILLVDGSDAESSLIPLYNDLDTVLYTLDYYQPDIVHFCDDLSFWKDKKSNFETLIVLQENIKKRFAEIKIMRSIPIMRQGSNINGVDSLEIARIFEPYSDLFLTDTLLEKVSGSADDHQPVQGFVGITGKTCDWDLSACLTEASNIPVILAGGISPDNVFEGIKKVRPEGVDSCTLTNALDSTGNPVRFEKDTDKVKRFVDEVHRAEKYLNTIKSKDKAE